LDLIRLPIGQLFGMTGANLRGALIPKMRLASLLSGLVFADSDFAIVKTG
jgi:hypothetical protein